MLYVQLCSITAYILIVMFRLFMPDQVLRAIVKYLGLEFFGMQGKQGRESPLWMVTALAMMMALTPELWKRRGVVDTGRNRQMQNASSACRGLMYL